MIAPAVGVIGCGLSGIACARALVRAGLRPRIFEAQRAAGGRLATRRFEAASFDHGAQYVTTRDPEFRRTIEAARAAGVAGQWRPQWPAHDPADGDLWVGVSGMSNLPRFLAQDLDVEYGTRILRLERGREGWILADDRGLAHVEFDLVVLALPAPVAATLATPHSTLAERVQGVPMAPCWAAMAAFERPLDGVPDAAFDPDPMLAWFARDGSKPGRGMPDAWVLHGGADWSRIEFDQPPARVLAALLERFSERIGLSLPPVVLSDCHRWRHARVERPLGEPFLWDREAGIAFCGDWCLDGRAEAAWLSGHALGTALSEARPTAGSGKMLGSR
jgi:predicted NAD/FAD-dependent oxidoreductase